VAEPTVEVLKGTLDVLILKTLSWGPAHGYAVSRWIRDVTDQALVIEEGALYPALHRLEQRGWVSAEWGLSDNNRRARYYRLTPQGRAQLRREMSGWDRFAAAVSKVLTATEQPDWAR
jgi:PadR family transcriptional regulator, regulatory protein PadR